MEQKDAILGILAKNIKGLRYSAQLSQEELAERLGVGVQTVSALERGVRKPSFDTLVGLADVFGVEAGELLSSQTDAWMVAKTLQRRDRT